MLRDVLTEITGKIDMRRLILISILCVIGLQLLSCKSKTVEIEITKQSEEMTSLDEKRTEQSDEMTSLDEKRTEQSDETLSNTTDSTEDDTVGSLPRITWCVMPYPLLTEDTLNDINHRLLENGIRCQVEVISVSDPGVEYEKWLEELKTKGEAPDIMLSGYWENGVLDAVAFAKKEFFSLNEYLQAEEGAVLQSSFSELEWSRVTIDGNIYTLPGRRDTLKDQGEVYLWVKDSYREEFKKHFDGSYESLHMMCRKNADGEQLIVAGDFYDSVVLSFLDSKELFYASYDPRSKQVIDLTKRPKTKEFLRMLYEDYRDGVCVRVTDPSELPNNAVAYICANKIDSLQGYTEMILSDAHFRSIMAASYGVLASSPNKELALKVLSVCFSDPGIASRLSWISGDAQKWQKLTEYYNTREPSSITGFIPDLSMRQRETIHQYSDDLFGIVNSMYITGSDGKTVLNSNYLELLEDFFAEPKDYGDIFDVINEQLDCWFERKGE